jgi:hypothetical protein
MLGSIALIAVAAASPDPSCAEAASKAHVQRVAVYDFELSGVDKRIGRIVTDATVAELRKLQGISVVGMDEVRAALDMEAQKQMLGCTKDSCIAEIAEALGVDVIVIGQLAQVGDEKVFGLKRIEQRTGTATASVQQRLKSDTGEELLAMIGPSVEKAFSEFPLKAGAVRGVAPELALRVNPPPLDPWIFWSGAATTGAAVVTSGVAGVFNLVAVGDTGTYFKTAKLDGATLNGKESAVAASAVTFYSALGAAVVTGAATSVVALFTDFHGYREDGK